MAECETVSLVLKIEMQKAEEKLASGYCVVLFSDVNFKNKGMHPKIVQQP